MASGPITSWQIDGETMEIVRDFISLEIDLRIDLRKLRSWHPVPSLHGKLMGKQWKYLETLYPWAPKSLWMMTEATKIKDTFSLEEKL